MTKAEIKALFMEHLDNLEDDFQHCDADAVLDYLARLVYDEIIHQTVKVRFDPNNFGYARNFSTPTFQYESTENEQEEMKAFVAEHDKKCPASKSATGEKYIISLMPGGLGTCISIKCLACGKVEEVTDTSCW